MWLLFALPPPREEDGVEGGERYLERGLSKRLFSS